MWLTCPGLASAQRSIEVAHPAYCAGQTCFTTEQRCERYVSDARDLGRRTGTCRERPRMTCFQYRDVTDRNNDIFTRCFTAPAPCARALRRFRRGNYFSRTYDSPRYYNVRECLTRRFSPALVRREEALVRQQAEYRERAAALAPQLERMRGGISIDRELLCDGRARCAIANSEMPADPTPWCMAVVMPAGALRLLCWSESFFCNADGPGIVAAMSPELALRFTPDCFAVVVGGPDDNIYIVSDAGDVTPPAIPAPAPPTPPPTPLPDLLPAPIFGGGE